MTVSSLRSALRDGTSALHLELDNAVGEFGDRLGYADFVQKTHRFRLAVEQALAGAPEGSWAVEPIADLAAHDLADLGVPKLPEAEVPSRDWTPESRLGALYVLEGSALGARLLMRRAQALGLHADFGARHLAHQASDSQRWRGFLGVLESVPSDMHATVLSAARDMFGVALAIYSETAHECA
ncbi:biliverdin-producing heme oxygenase [Hoeflea ulvae]|uniref:Biliverdin-producing heme oxygenase n=1 Tax=Hoeflea ulvae TaxID=2983764 RepID=A0ABT3YCD7_9HYPH|nr:biliverdin-producing heme oxygenase [Hoeflea ulvae]MCY0093550.1 biliverdin-producing heme oxygenase [Hoeflea ulvae]